MKKILFATPYKGNVGGISTWATHIVSQYELAGKDCCQLDIFPMNSLKPGRLTSRMSFYKRVISGIQTYLSVIFRLKKILKNSQYDILHISSSASLGLIKDLWMLNIAHNYNVKSIVHFHFGRIPQVLESNSWERLLLKRVISKADQIIVMDQASFYALKKHCYNNICLIPNPLSNYIIDIVRRKGKVKRDYRTITFVGHVVRNKGVFELIEACNAINDVVIRIVGPVKQEMKEQLLKKANDSNILEFIGTLPLEEVIGEMLKCTVFVLPTYSEGFPNVIIESMACGCPIVTTNVGAIPEMLNINGNSPCGLCIEPRNVEQLKQALLVMLDNPNVAKEFGKCAKVRVHQEYTMDVVWKLLVNTWNNLYN